MKTFDLTHALYPSIPSWDGSCGFRLETNTDYADCQEPYLFKTQTVTSRAGMGTHIDAPAHCFPGAVTIDRLPLENLIVDCFVLKVNPELNERFVLTAADVLKFEKQHGTILPRSFIIVSTGWSKFWCEPEKYRNNLQFPSIEETAAALFVERGIVGLGTDTLSADAGGQRYPVHQQILGSGRYLVENIANAEQLPATGAKIYVLPIKIAEGTEAPIRLLATVES